MYGKDKLGLLENGTPQIKILNSFEVFSSVIIKGMTMSWDGEENLIMGGKDVKNWKARL